MASGAGSAASAAPPSVVAPSITPIAKILIARISVLALPARRNKAEYGYQEISSKPGMALNWRPFLPLLRPSQAPVGRPSTPSGKRGTVTIVTIHRRRRAADQL